MTDLHLPIYSENVRCFYIEYVNFLQILSDVFYFRFIL